MYRRIDGDAIIEKIRALDQSVSKIKLTNVEIERAKNEITFYFICENTVSPQVKDAILEQLKIFVPPVLGSVQILIKKIVSNAQLINGEIFKFLSENYPSFSSSLKQTDVLSVVVGEMVKYTLRLTQSNVEYVLKSGVMAKLNKHLSSKFCSDFVGSVDVKEPEETVSLLVDEVYEQEVEKIEHRTITVEDVIIVDDRNLGNIAQYIEDVTFGEVTICGTITEISERQTKTGKPFFIITIDDTTAKMGGIYFSKADTLGVIRSLAVGDAIITRGTVGDYNGRRSFTLNKINKCTFPENFVKKDKYKKTAPKEYSLIRPESAKTVKVKSVFDEDGNLPTELTDKTYVVFDLETTGLDLMNNGITEIGAVKIENGVIKEHWTTLVKPDYTITSEITKITGITEEMVSNSPKISSVIPDFMKFIEGTVLVAHNAEFDVKFIKRFAGAEEYEVKNKVVDSVDLARECLPQLKKHDLHTVAEYFKIVFNHHRALSDAYATAEIFIELMKIKYNK